MKVIALVFLMSLMQTLFAVEVFTPQLISLEAKRARIYVLSPADISLRLRYQEQGATDWNSINSSGRHQHMFVLRDLLPQKQYHYMVQRGQHEIARGSFKTPQQYPQRIRFTVFGHAQRPHISKSLQQSLVSSLKKETADMILYTGNVFGSYHDAIRARDWQQHFYQPYGELMQDGLMLWSSRLAVNDDDLGIHAQRKHMPLIDSRSMQCFQHGPVAFVVIAESHVSFNAFIKNLEHALQQSSFARWRCVSFYPSLLTRGASSWSELELQAIHELFHRYRVDVVFSGSEQQCYLRWRPLKQTARQHAVLYVNTGLGMQSMRKSQNHLATINDQHAHYLTVEADAQRLELRCKRLDQRVLDRISIDRQRYQAYLQTAIPIVY